MYSTEFGLLFCYHCLNFIENECFCSDMRVNSMLKYRIVAYIYQCG